MWKNYKLLKFLNTHIPVIWNILISPGWIFLDDFSLFYIWGGIQTKRMWTKSPPIIGMGGQKVLITKTSDIKKKCIFVLYNFKTCMC